MLSKNTFLFGNGQRHQERLEKSIDDFISEMPCDEIDRNEHTPEMKKIVKKTAGVGDDVRRRRISSLACDDPPPYVVGYDLNKIPSN